MPTRRAALLTLVVAGSVVAVPSAAQAAYPGQNGALLYGVAKYDKKAKNTGYLKPGGLASTNPDGSGTTALPDDKKYDDFDPQWSPDGTQFAYASAAGGQYDGIYVATPGGTKPKLVAKAISPASPTWSPDGKTLVWVDYLDGIYSAPATPGSTAQLLATHTKQVYSVSPSFSADGKTIFFGRDRQGKKGFSDIWAMDPSGENERRVLGTSTAGQYFDDPDVSPDSSRLTYSQFDVKSGRSAVWIAAVDGSGARELTGRARTYLAAPVWSPDGSKIAVSEVGNSPKQGSSLLVLDAATGAATTVRKVRKAFVISPSWQPLTNPL